MIQTASPMPQYQSHKKVWALKIKDIIHESDGGATINPVDEKYSAFKVDSAYINKHSPQVDGYYVVYEGGYKSWSPAKEFEEGYTLIQKNEPNY